MEDRRLLEAGRGRSRGGNWWSGAGDSEQESEAGNMEHSKERKEKETIKCDVVRVWSIRW